MRRDRIELVWTKITLAKQVRLRPEWPKCDSAPNLDDGGHEVRNVIQFVAM